MDWIVLVQHHCKLIRDVNAGRQGLNLFYVAITQLSLQTRSTFSLFSFFSIHISKTLAISVEQTSAKLGKNPITNANILG